MIVEGPTWQEAEANAVALGGHLVTINDAEENEWINNTFGRYATFDNGLGLMIGYTDQVEEGSWEWASGIHQIIPIGLVAIQTTQEV